MYSTSFIQSIAPPPAFFAEKKKKEKDAVSTFNKHVVFRTYVGRGYSVALLCPALRITNLTRGPHRGTEHHLAGKVVKLSA
jgi:hypothetical protein